MTGFFDSGSGGLSVLSHFRRLAPRAGIVYFGDIKNAPYGEKSAQELAALTAAGVGALRERGATAIVSACNSVSPAILGGASGTLPFVEMTAPTAAYMRQFAGQRFLLLATPATVASGIYARALEGIVSLDSLGIAGLAGAIEFGGPEEKIRSLVSDALEPKRGERYDGVILGCTHYPLALATIAPIAGSVLATQRIIDPGEAVAAEAARAFAEGGDASARFFISQESAAFRARVGALFADDPYTIEVI